MALQFQLLKLKFGFFSCLLFFYSTLSWGNASAEVTANPAKLEIKEFEVALGNATAIGNIGTSTAVTIKSLMTQINANAQQCVSTRNKTAKECSEDGSSNMTQALSLINNYGTAASAISSAFSACSEFTKTITRANALAQLYRISCNAAIGSCTSSCGSINANMNALKTNLEKLKTEYSSSSGIIIIGGNINSLQSFVQNQLNTNADTVAGMANFCQVRAAQTLASSATQLASSIQLLQKVNGCSTDVSSGANSSESFCIQNPSASQCDCSLDNQKNTARCLCLSDPRGCSNSYAAGAQQKIGTGDLSNMSPNAASGKSGMSLSDNSEDEKINFAKNNNAQGGPVGGGGAGAPVGGSGGAGNQLGANGGRGAGAAGKVGPSALGGWGGGGSSGSFNSAAGSSEEMKQLQKYLPGQKQDPKRQLSSISFRSEVTGQGGKSNWEKVRERYKDMVPTLLGN